MIDSSTLSSDTTNISNPIQPYQFTLRRGFLALFVMYACQTLVGLAFAYGVKFFSNDVRTLDIQMIGMSSVLVGGILVLLLAWLDIHRLGRSFVPQIGLHRSEVKTSDAIILVFLLLSTTHFFAWIYRSVFLPLVDQGGIIGGGSQMFTHIQETGSAIRMVGFLVLALFVGPVMEEIVFRAYLQSPLARCLPSWIAISITSLLSMAGHGPIVLWPMYFGYSVAWGWIFMHTGSLKISIAIHLLSNLFCTVVASMGWNIA